MPFVKLDCGILNSTLWVEREPRDVFITALLMAQPHEVTTPMPQYKVRALEPTGFVVQPGWYGFIQAAGPGIVRMAMAEQQAGMDALEKLGAPDPESRSSEFEGRRLVRVDGGYIVLNYMKYRDKDSSAADRMRRYRQRKKETSETELRRNGDAVTRNPRRDVTKAEAEAEAEAEIQIPSLLAQAPALPAEDRLPPDLRLVDSPTPTPAPPPRPPDCPHLAVLALWAEVLPSMPQHLPSQWRGARADHLRARWRETAAEKGWTTEAQGLTHMRKLFGFIGQSQFLTGRSRVRDGKRPFAIELEWLVSPTNWAKVIEGKYHTTEAA